MDRELALRVADRYAKGSRAARGYIAGKLRADPVISRIVEIGSERNLGHVIDIGCGRGQLAIALLEAKAATSVLGFDWDESKIEIARTASMGLAARFEIGDVRTMTWPAADTALLIDVLHYVRFSEQEAILQRACMATKSMVLVRELDPDRGWRSAITRLQERMTTSFAYNTGERLEYRSISAISTLLETHGFLVEVEPAWGFTPFSNVLVMARRR